MVIGYIFPLLVCCANKNLAALHAATFVNVVASSRGWKLAPIFDSYLSLSSAQRLETIKSRHGWQGDQIKRLFSLGNF
jgi:hypothetical protein